MSEDLKSYIFKYIGEKAESVNAFGCNFAVFRHNKSKGKKLISVSFWKGSPGYIYSLQMSLLEWVSLINKYFQCWYIRFYVDANIFKAFTPETRRNTAEQIKKTEIDRIVRQIDVMVSSRLAVDKMNNNYSLFDALNIDREKEFDEWSYDKKLYDAIEFDKLIDKYLNTEGPKSIDGLIAYIANSQTVNNYLQPTIDKQMNFIDSYNWREVMQQLIKHKEVELWFYQCQWGYQTTQVMDPVLDRHLNTFGSLVRFHPFDDNDVDIVLVRNIESLTSHIDRKVVDRWIDSGKTFCIYAFPEYVCLKHDVPIYNSTCQGLDNEIMILATINYNKTGKNNRFENCIIYDNIIKHIRSSSNTYVKTFAYGIDEVILTKCVKPYLLNNPDDFEIIYLTQYFMTRYGGEGKEGYETYYGALSKRYENVEPDADYENSKKKYKELFLKNELYYFPDDEIGERNLFAFYHIFYVPAIFPGLAFKYKNLRRVTHQQKAIEYYFPEKFKSSKVSKFRRLSSVSLRDMYFPESNKSNIYRNKYLKYKQKYLLLKNQISSL